MIFGICSKKTTNTTAAILDNFPGAKLGGQAVSSGQAGFYYQPDLPNTEQKRQSGLWHSLEKQTLVLFQGRIFNEDEIRQEFELSDSGSLAEICFEVYSKNGSVGFSKFNGHFAIAIYEQNINKLTLVRDHFGVELLYFYHDPERIIFSSSLQVILKYGEIPRELSYKGIYAYLLFNYVPIKDTFVTNLFKLLPAHQLTWHEGAVKQNRYWHLKFKQNKKADESYFTKNILDLLNDSVAIRLDGNGTRPGAFLSGGMDSSSIVGLSTSKVDQKFETFSFRCKGKSFDESRYAQIMSDEYGTNHHLVEFPPEEIRSISKLVELMPEPFCDIGIEIASYLLAKNASEQVDYVLSGDGGDELFAGHPVYIADKIAKVFDAIPGFIRSPLVHLLQYLPDTDKKKSLVVKAKRFSYSFNFPSSLYSNRWRIYYTPPELRKATNPDFWEKLQHASPIHDIESYYDDADGEDFLSRTLYGDYLTVVNFYLTRMYMLRHFGIEARFPMFDYRLVEFAATIPSGLKIKGRNDTKYILKKTMAGVLPDSIVFRKDKLGHSVPMKNWMRDDPSVRDLIYDVLSEENVNKRGFFRPEFVRQLIDEHMSKKCNHSHRIWALLVLELWLQKHFDRIEHAHV
jgi:asparagine synthase (glutamine-hydrolysing)